MCSTLIVCAKLLGHREDHCCLQTVRRDTSFSVFWFSEVIAAEYFGPLFCLLSVLNTVTCLDPEALCWV